MANSISRVPVPDAQALESAVLAYLAQGYAVAERTPERVLLQKRRQFELLWAVIGFLLCLLPLIIYLVIYVLQPEAKVVEIAVVPRA